MPFEYVPLLTLADVIEYLLDCANVTGDPEARRKARRVVLEAYRELPLRHEWTHFVRQFNVTMDASQSDGTVAFDLTGGTYERMLTLTDSTWPANAEYGEVEIDNIHYPIESRKSDTVVTLREQNSPVADIAAGTTYTYYRALYPVPIDYRKGSELVSFDEYGRTLEYMSPADLQAFKASWRGPQSWQLYYTIRPSSGFYSGLAFEFAPPPSEAKAYSGTYLADPRPIGLIGTSTEYSTGTVSITGTAATFVGTALTSRMQGCVLRLPVSGTSTVPTGRGGVYGNDNPYAEQRVIEEVLTATTATIDQAPDGTYSGAKYTIGDPIDFDYHCMIDAFKALCQWKFAEAIKASIDSMEAKEKAWKREFARALGADDRTPEQRERYWLPWYPLALYAEVM